MSNNFMNDNFHVFDVTTDPQLLHNKSPEPFSKGSLRIWQLFRFCTLFDLLLLFVGIISSFIAGGLVPIPLYFMGQVIDTVSSYVTLYTSSSNNNINVNLNENIMSQIEEDALNVVLLMAYFGVGSIVIGILNSGTFFLLSERQGIKIRKVYFQALIRQDATWYDAQNKGELLSHIASDVKTIQDGIGVKFSILFQSLGTLISGFVIAFVLCWDLALIIFSVLPFIFGSMVVVTKIVAGLTSKSNRFLSKSGSISEEAITSIRTVHSLNSSDTFCNKYNTLISKMTFIECIRSLISAIGTGILFFLIICSNALAGWYGSLIIQGKGVSDSITVGQMLTVFMTVLMITQTLSLFSVPMTSLTKARVVAYKVFKIIRRIPDVDSLSFSGKCPSTCYGSIEFQDVQFSYPTRPFKQILKGFDLTVYEGETVALVGGSGCGKSTVIQLLQRIYDVNGGYIKIDDVNVKELQLNWLRKQIGLVGQEPVLFGCSIKENILLGANDDDKITDESVFEAAKMANAHDFITNLPNGYDTIIGEKGSQLSGGQKQRIAIARALIKDPKILLLDEATSALDTESEKIVQEALEKASQGRTTIIVAHRLSTIRNADRICVMHQGEIIESGTHDELLKLKGSYYNSIDHQELEDSVKTPRVINTKHAMKQSIDVNGNTIPVDQQRADLITKKKLMEAQVMEISNKHPFIKTLWNSACHNWIFTIFGIIGSIGAGAIIPFFTLQVSELCQMLLVLIGTNFSVDDKIAIRNQALKITAIGVASFISQFIFFSNFGFIGARTIGKLRKALFHSIVNQEIGWFDRKENMVGSLLNRLDSDVTTIEGILGERIGQTIVALSLLICSLSIAFVVNWSLTLILAISFPIVITVLMVNGRLYRGAASPSEKSYESCGVTLVEVVESIKTIQSLCKEKHFYKKYSKDLKRPLKISYFWAPVISIVHGISICIPFFIQGAGLYVGVWLISRNIDVNTTTKTFIINYSNSFFNSIKVLVISACIFKAVSDLGGFIPDYGKGIDAAKNVYNTIERREIIGQYGNNVETKLDSIKGEIEFKDVFFRYPERVNSRILRGLSFKANQGKTIALVGSSGCGKSTVIQLLEKFYDTTFGDIYIDGHNISTCDSNWLRKQIGLVGQEPALFSESIMDNIKRGAPEEMNITNEHVYKAAKLANAHDFITAMSEGYNTLVGEKGSQLSGGQKQRIAIARALIRDPKILLLDEATSALDTESEKIVQEALEKASQGRTTIIVAHRLSTIRNADEICVMVRGKVAERGTHDELLKKNGFYSTLAIQQTFNS
ncbi:Multidrug resistance protein 4 [Entamoeba marina]